jgi:hypothetical protein
MATAPENPVRYRDDLEHFDASESATTQALEQVLNGIITTTAKHGGHGLRAVHAKSHALLEGTLTVSAGLPAVLAQGLFAKPGTYPLIMRFSTIPGDLLHDRISVPRGLALKVLGVEGERLPGSEDAQTQDFLLASGPAFAAPTPDKFLSSLKLLASTTDRAEWAKKLLSVFARGAERGLEAIGQQSAALMTFGGYPHTNPSSETFYSQTPFRFGDYIAKFSVVPSSDNLLALRDKVVDLAQDHDALRAELTRTFESEGGTWDLQAQLLTNLNTMPIEDGSVAWPETESPFVTVAKLSVGPQPVWTQARSAVGDDQMAFSPWHGLASHRPLGAINRARKQLYNGSANLRSQINKCPIHEPMTGTKLPMG